MSDNDLTPAAAIRTAVFSVPTAPTESTAPASPSPSAPPGVTAPSTPLAIAAMLQAGKIDAAAAGKLSKAAGLSTAHVADALHSLRQIGESPEPDGRSPEVKELDAAFPPAKPDEFLIRYAAPGQSEEMVRTKEVTAFDQSARVWLSGAEFPRDLGNSLVSTIARVVGQTGNMTQDQLISYGETEYLTLQQAYGATLDERLQEAGRMVEALEAKTPGLKNLLRSKGIGDSAMVASLLIQQSQRYWTRRR